MKRQASASQRYYEYDTQANDFASVIFPMDRDDEIREIHWKDAPLLKSWKPPRCEVLDDYAPTEGDFPNVAHLGSVPLMTERAWNALRPLIGYCCEALPIIHPSGRPYFIVHVMNTIDCLDAAASKVSRSEGRKNRIDRIYRYAFKDEMIRGEHIFKLPHLSGGDLIVNDEFRKVVENNGLQGLEFKPLPM